MYAEIYVIGMYFDIGFVADLFTLNSYQKGDCQGGIITYIKI